MSSSKLATFNALSIYDQFYLLASHLPQGTFWENCFNEDSNLGKLTKALSLEYYRMGVLVEDIAYDYDIRQVDNYISEWENSVGIPNSCFSRNRTIEQRRLNIEGLFSNFAGVQTNEDFVRMGLLYGYVVDVYSGIDVGGFDMIFPIILFDSKKEAKNTIIINLTATTTTAVNFPFEFPIPFYKLGIQFLNCIFSLVKPANCDLILTSQYNI